MERYYPLPQNIFDGGLWGSVVVGPDGITLHVICYDAGEMVYRRSDDEGKTWNAPVVIDTNATNNVLERPLAVTANGVLVAVYEAGTEFRMSRSTNNGVSWSTPTVVGTYSNGQFVRGAMGVDGETIHLVYSFINDGSTSPFWRGVMYYRKSTDAGANWSTAIEPYPNGATYESASRPCLCVNGDVVHLNWAALRTGDTILTNEEILTGRSTDGGSTWETPVIHKNNSATYAHRPDIVTDPNGVVLLVWQESLDGGGPGDLDLQFRRSSNDGDSWGSIVRITNSATGDRAEHAVLGLSGNRVALVWAEYVSSVGRPWAMYSEDAGVTWTSVEIISDAYVAQAPAVALSNNFVQVISTDANDELFAFRSWFDVTEPVETDLLEDFEGAAAGPPPSANWANGVITNVAGEGIVKDGSGRGTRKSTGGYRQGSHWISGAFGPDVDIVMELDSVPTSEFDGIHFGQGFAFGASALDAYGANVERTASGEFAFFIWKNVNSTLDTLAVSIETPTVAAGDRLALQRRGELIRILHKPSAGAWGILVEETDSAFNDLSGYPYLELVGDQSCRVRNMWATTIVEIPPLQQLRPDADVVTTGWATAPLYSKINDESDATVITATAS